MTATAPAATSVHRRIRGDIEDAIVSGRWPPGHRVPSEQALMESYGCSRMTVNRAMGGLAAAGLVTRKRRVGTIVAQPPAQQALLDIPDMKAEVERRGQTYGYELLDLARRRARRDDAARLGVRPGTRIVALQCRHSCDGVIFAHEDRLLNLSAVAGLALPDFTRVPPNSWLVGQVPWTEAEHRISARNATPDEAAALGISPGAACLALERRTWRTGESITAVTMLHPGALYHLIGRFNPTG